MKIAVIPPIPELDKQPSTGVHLLLSHLLASRKYTNYYRRRREAGDYLILDNSAHEHGVGEMGVQLLGKAALLRAQEVVLPDVLFDERGTVERTKQMLKWVVGAGWELYSQAGYPRLMLVPQGDTRPEWAKCLSGLLRAWDQYGPRAEIPFDPPVIGISKDYDYWKKGLTGIIEDYVAVHRRERNIDVHCLGWPNDLWSITRVARHFPWVRSTDSAKPHVYAKNGIMLEPGGKVPKYPRRDKDYFEEAFDAMQRAKARRNTEVFNAAASDQLIMAA